MSDLKKAAQQALEALMWHDEGMRTRADSEAITALRAALEEQEQEPVEIKPPNPEGATQCIVRWFAETPAGWVGAWDREALERFTAHPPRREWRGLTEEDLAELARQEQLLLICDDLDALRVIARAIEAALKERNT